MKKSFFPPNLFSEFFSFAFFILLLFLFLQMSFQNIKGLVRILISILFIILAFFWKNPFRGLMVLSPLILGFSLKWYLWYDFLYPFSISKGGGILVPIHFLDIIALLFALFYIPYKFLYKDSIKDPFSPFLILQIIIFLISSFFAYDERFSFLYILLWIAGFLFYRGILFGINNETLYKNFLISLFFLLFFNLIIGTLQRHFGSIPILGGVLETPVSGTLWSGRIKGTFAHPNSFSGIFAILTPFFIGLGLCFREQLKKWMKISLIFLLLWATYLLLFTYSRIGYLSLFSSLLSFSFLSLFFSEKKLRMGKILLLIIAGSIFIFFVIKFLFPTVYIRILSIGWWKKEVSIAIRLSFWENSLKTFLKHPLIGIGIAQFAYQPYSLYHLHPHNYFIGLLLETGITGFLISFSFIIYVFYLLWKEAQINRGSSLKWIWIGLLSGWIAFLIHSMADMVWFSIIAAEERKIYWIFLSLISLTLFNYGKFSKKRNED